MARNQGITEELVGAYNFLLEIGGITSDQTTIIGGFSSVSGLETETEVVEFRQGNDSIVRKKAGRTKHHNIVLERGYTATDDLFKWRKNIEDGIIDRRAGTLTLLDQDGVSVVAEYNFYEAFPCKWIAPELDADGGMVTGKEKEQGVTQKQRERGKEKRMAIERIELAVEKLERVLR